MLIACFVLSVLGLYVVAYIFEEKCHFAVKHGFMLSAVGGLIPEKLGEVDLKGRLGDESLW